MISGFLLNDKDIKNKKDSKTPIKNMMKKLPLDLENIIIDYKYKFEHNLKMQKIKKELLNIKYICGCCLNNKFKNITKIGYVCKCCKIPTCIDCMEYCNQIDDENNICNECFILFCIYSKIEELIKRKLTHDEMNEISDLLEDIEDIEDREELLIVLDVIIEYHSEVTEEGFFNYENMIIELEEIIESLLEEE